MRDDIRSNLVNQLSYSEAFYFIWKGSYDEEIEPLFLEITQILDDLIANKNEIAQIQQQESNSSFKRSL